MAYFSGMYSRASEAKKEDETSTGSFPMRTEDPAPAGPAGNEENTSLIVTDAIRMHDMFNIYCTGFIVCVAFTFLIYATEWDKFMSADLGIEYRPLSHLLLVSMALYLVIDTVWIYVQPSCVLSGASALIAHHLASLGFCYLPFKEPRYSWHMAINLAVEINTFALVARRNVPLRSAEYTFLNVLFYSSWVVFRLVIFPALVLFYYAEYVEYTHLSEGGNGNPWNMVLWAPVLQGLLTAMGYKWTYDMLAKMMNKSEKNRQKSQ